MPSETFFRLPEKKKNRLLDSALQEFSRASYHDASISNMILTAGISRGSFYQYFQDKEDLYQYVLKSHFSIFTDILLQELKQANGDFEQTFLNFFDATITYLKQSPYQSLFQNVFYNLNPKTEKFIFPHQEDCQLKLVHQILEQLDITKLWIQNELELYYVLDIVLHMMIPLLADAILSIRSIEEVNKEYQIKLKMICEGIYRKESDIC